MKRPKKKSKRINWKQLFLKLRDENASLREENCLQREMGESFERFAKFYKKDLDYLDQTINKKLELILLLLPEHLGSYDAKISSMIKDRLVERENARQN